MTAKQRPPDDGEPSDGEVERRRQALKRAMDSANMRPADVARDAGLPSPNAIYNFLRGKRSKGLSAETYRKIAKVIPGSTVASLQGIDDSPPPSTVLTVTVKAEAKAGALRASFDLPLDEQTEAPMPIDRALIAEGAFGVVVRRPGAELLYRDGTILVVMPISAYEGSLTGGRRVVLQRIRDRSVEVTIRELQVIEGKAWLRAGSIDPRHDTSVEMRWPGGVERMWKHGDDRYWLAGVVIGSYQPEG